MPKKREPSKPKVVWVGSTPITPITDKERRETDKRIRKHREKLRQRYIEVHDRVVDHISRCAVPLSSRVHVRRDRLAIIKKN